MNYLLDIFILILLEFIEANTVKARSLKEVIEWFFYIIKNKKLTFISMHFSLIYLIYFTISNDINSFFVTSAIMMKFVDLLFKLYLVRKVDENGHFSIINVLGVPDMAISNRVKYSGLVIYPLCVFIGVS